MQIKASKWGWSLRKNRTNMHEGAHSHMHNGGAQVSESCPKSVQ